ncbi:MAG: D-glycero-alpha-D-manno-heptose-1,7-bisphosphate 7-phosphatase [Bacteroidales bacterium]
MTPAVFLDRDGTLIEEVGYLDALDRIVVFPWSIDAIRALNDAGFKVVVVSNQAGVARGFFGEAFVKEVHRSLDRRIVAGGARVDGWYYCPHHPDAPLSEYRQACSCRKPMPGMAQRAAADLDIDLARSFVIGDRWLDVEMAQNAGARGILVRTGYGAAEEREPKPGVAPAFIADNVIAAVAWILALGSRL